MKCSGIRIHRRRFLRQLAASGAVVGFSPAVFAESRPEFTAAVIGHTGQGNYGHDLDLIFTGRSDVKLLAVADPDGAGREKALQRTGAPCGYADYREMLQKEKPRLVCVAPRWTNQRHAMAAAALRSGAHVFSEKPFTATLAEADDLLALATASRLKVAVAHQMRLAPNILFLKTEVERGLIGQLVEMRAHGKQDSRAGGEDLVVLGIHLFHLMRLFAGDPLWCTARVLQKRHEISTADAHRAGEDIGPVAGDEIFAQFAFSGGVNATFTSRAANRDTAGPWGLELGGSQGVVRIFADICPSVYLRSTSEVSGRGKSDQWLPIPGDSMLEASEAEKTVGRANARVVDDWLASIREARQPACSGHSAMGALEMVMAVFAAGLKKTRVQFPLKERQHPLMV